MYRLPILSRSVGRSSVFFRPSMPTRVRPIVRMAHIPMLHWIVMDVRDVVLKIVGITDCVLPKSALPNATFATSTTHVASADLGRFLEKLAFNKRQRVEKSWSLSGKVQMQWRWSGKITIASISNGCCLRTFSNELRNILILSTSRFCLRSRKLAVKKYVPPSKYRRR